MADPAPSNAAGPTPTPQSTKRPRRQRASVHFMASLLAALLSTCLTVAPAAELSPADRDAVRAAEQARVEVIDHVDDTVVLIYGENPAKGGGSGVLFHPAGLVLTNFHVVKGAGGETGWAGLNDGKLYRWRLVGIDPGGDLAMIQLIGRETWPYAELGDSDAVRVGDFALAMGNPFALAHDQTPTVTMGVVSGTHRYQGGVKGNLLVYGDCIQIDTSINPGNSGGPLFDMTGRVIGINGRGSFEERGRVNVGLGYAITARQVRNFIPDLMATRVVRHGTLDAVFAERGGNVIATAVDLDRCPLVEHGFNIGDQLVRFNGRPIDSANQYLNALSILPADWPVEVQWRHDGALKSAQVRLNPSPYADQPRRVAVPSPPEPDDADEKKKDDQPNQRVIKVEGAGMPAHGEIARPGLNRINAQRVLARWSPDAAKLTEGGPAEALLQATAAMILERATGGGGGRSAFQALVLLGGEKIDGQRSFVIRADFPDGRRGLYHLSAFNERGQLHHEMLRARWLEADAEDADDKTADREKEAGDE